MDLNAALPDNHQARVDLFGDPSQDLVLAPKVVQGALVSLAGGTNPAALSYTDLGSATTDGTWTTAWLTVTELIYVRATKNGSGWTLVRGNSRTGTADQMTGWSRPLTGVVSVNLAGAVARRQDFNDGDPWEWEASTAVRFDDGTDVTFPFTAHPDAVHLNATETFLSAFHAARSKI